MISKRCTSLYPSAGCSAGVITNTPPSVASSSGGPQEQSRQNMHRFFQGFAHLSPFAIEPVGSCNYPYHSSPLFPRTVDTILAIGQEKLYGARHHIPSRRLGTMRGEACGNNGAHHFESFTPENAFITRMGNHKPGL